MVRKGWINFVSYALEVLSFEICRPNFLLHTNLVPWFVKKREFITLNEYIFSFWFTIHNINLWSTLCIPKFYIRLKFSRFSNKPPDSLHLFGLIHSFMRKAEEPEIKLPTPTGSSKKQEFQKNIYICFIDYAKAFDCVDHNRLWKVLQEMGIPDHLTCLLRSLYAGQEAKVRAGHGKRDSFPN